MAQSVTMTGYVLRKHLLPSHDAVVHVYSREYGKVSLIAKGLRATQSKRSAMLQTGNLITAEFLEREDLSLLTTTQLISGFTSLKADWMRAQIMYSLLLVVDRLAPPFQAEPQIYLHLHSGMIGIAQSDSPAAVFRQQIRRMIPEFGYVVPEIDQQLYGALEQLIDEKLPIRDIIENG